MTIKNPFLLISVLTVLLCFGCDYEFNLPDIEDDAEDTAQESPEGVWSIEKGEFIGEAADVSPFTLTLVLPNYEIIDLEYKEYLSISDGKYRILDELVSEFSEEKMETINSYLLEYYGFSFNMGYAPITNMNVIIDKSEGILTFPDDNDYLNYSCNGSQLTIYDAYYTATCVKSDFAFMENWDKVGGEND